MRKPSFTRAWAALLAVAPLLGAGLVQSFDIEIVNQGKPAAGVEVMLLVNQGKVDLGTSPEDGVLDVSMELVNLGKGTPIDVYRIECDGEVVIVLVAPGEEEQLDEECERRRRENPNCECRRIGAFLWGDDVTIDVGTRTVTQGETGGPSTGGNLTLGLGFDVRQMLELDDALGEVDGVTDHDATAWAPGLQLFGEYLLWGILALGIEAAYSQMDTETQLTQGLQTGSLDYYEIGGTAKIGPRVEGPLWPYAVIALYRTWNKADFELDGLSEHRVHKTRRDGLGLGLQYWYAPRWGLRFEGLYNTTFEDQDADEHIRWKLGLMFRPFSRITY